MALKGTVLSALRYAGCSLYRAVTHPRTPIRYRNEGGNPSRYKLRSPIPWWGAALVIIIGIGCWIVGCELDITGLDEAARVMVYAPLGYLFDLSVQATRVRR